MLAVEFPDCMPVLLNMYAKHGTTRFRDIMGAVLRIILESGSTQGDVYGSLIFCAAFSHAILSLKAKWGGKVQVVADHDDLFMQASPRHLNEIMDDFRRYCADINLSISLPKSHIWLPEGDLSDTVLPQIPAANRRSGPTGGILVVGTPIGSDEFVRQHMEQVMQHYAPLHALIRSMPQTWCGIFP